MNVKDLLIEDMNVEDLIAQLQKTLRPAKCIESFALFANIDSTKKLWKKGVLAWESEVSTRDIQMGIHYRIITSLPIYVTLRDEAQKDGCNIADVIYRLISNKLDNFKPVESDVEVDNLIQFTIVPDWHLIQKAKEKAKALSIPINVFWTLFLQNCE